MPHRRAVLGVVMAAMLLASCGRHDVRVGKDEPGTGDRAAWDAAEREAKILVDRTVSDVFPGLTVDVQEHLSGPSLCDVETDDSMAIHYYLDVLLPPERLEGAVDEVSAYWRGRGLTVSATPMEGIDVNTDGGVNVGAGVDRLRKSLSFHAVTRCLAPPGEVESDGRSGP